MQTMDAIRSRRSVRRFRQEPVPLETLREIVRAGTLAASAGNRQPWHFVIVREPERVRQLTDTLGWLAGEPGPGQRPVAHVVVLLPRDASWSAQADAAAAIQNMLLAATDMGVGSCWFGSIDRDRLARLIGVPADRHVYSVVALGYPAEEPRLVEAPETTVRRDREGRLTVPKKPLEEVLSLERYGEPAGAPDSGSRSEPR